jgi:hypothetical protein
MCVGWGSRKPGPTTDTALIHKKILIDIDEVINRCYRQKQMRMKIEDWSKD